MSIQIADLDEGRFRMFSERLRGEREFRREFFANTLEVLDRELGIRINPGSRMAEELLRRVKEKEEENWVPNPSEAGCIIASYGDGCLIVMWKD